MGFQKSSKNLRANFCAMSFLNLFRCSKPKNAEENYERLLRNGRITEARVIDGNGENQDEITEIIYVYNINGADYESSHRLTAEQLKHPEKYAPGATVVIRYDPRQPGNSTVV
jgi:hypothetical protein